MAYCLICDGSSFHNEDGHGEISECSNCRDIEDSTNREDTTLEIIAARMTELQEKAALISDTGEDWSFHAAEHALTLPLFRQLQYDKNLVRVHNCIAAVADLGVVNALVDLLTSQPDPISPPEAIMESALVDDSVPF